MQRHAATETVENPDCRSPGVQFHEGNRMNEITTIRISKQTLKQLKILKIEFDEKNYNEVIMLLVFNFRLNKS